MQYSSASRLNDIASRLRTLSNGILEYKTMCDEIKDISIDIGNIVEED